MVCRVRNAKGSAQQFWPRHSSHFKRQLEQNVGLDVICQSDKRVVSRSEFRIQMNRQVHYNNSSLLFRGNNVAITSRILVNHKVENPFSHGRKPLQEIEHTCKSEGKHNLLMTLYVITIIDVTITIIST